MVQQLAVNTDIRLSTIQEVLGTPTFSKDGVLIYCGDALKAMERLPEGIIDLTITSTPYNIGKEYENILPLFLTTTIIIFIGPCVTI